jgi:alpha-D-ribose 1-methylphosphonate 5-triphosphate synthase subunit PhnH
VNTIELSELGTGFSDISLGSQSVFRAALEALSYPGRPVSLEVTFEAPRAAHASSSGLLLALLEPGSLLWLSPSLANTDAATWIVFHTDCKITPHPHEADFAWIKHWDELPTLQCFALGTDEYPDHSTTCVIDVAAPSTQTAAAPSLTLTGPGIAVTSTIEQLAATHPQMEGFVAQWTNNHASFPRGIDVFFATNTGLIGLPRTTRIQISG